MERVRTGAGVALLLFLALAVLAIVVLGRLPVQPSHPAQARITGIRVHLSRVSGTLVTITAQADNTIPATLTVHTLHLKCRVGDVVPATKRGVSLYISRDACLYLPQPPARS